MATGKLWHSNRPRSPSARFGREISKSMRPFAFVALIAGAGGSIGLMLHAKQHPPLFLLVLFTIWVLSPFIAFGIALLRSKRWTTPMQAALHLVTFAVALLSLLVY